MNLAGAAVALVILVDLATGQGPPILNNYMAGGLPPPQMIQLPPQAPIEFAQRPEYEQKKFEKEYEKPKDGYKPYGGEYGKEYEREKSTPAPGVLSSFSNSMSDAWSK